MHPFLFCDRRLVMWKIGLHLAILFLRHQIYTQSWNPTVVQTGTHELLHEAFVPMRENIVPWSYYLLKMQKSSVFIL